MTALDHTTAERAVLGALITGALGLADVARYLPEELFAHRLHREIFVVLLAVLEARRDGVAVPGRSGAPVRLMLEACARLGVRPAGAVCAVTGTDGRTWTEALGYVPSLARGAPRRGDARAALRELVEAWRDREESAQERAASLASLADLVPASLVALPEADLVTILTRLRGRRAQLLEAR